MIDTPLVSFPELPSICTINPFQLSDLSCWFLCLKTGTRMKSPLEDKAANTCEGRMVARVSLRLKTNGHLCIRRYINCWNWTNERDVISFWELKKPSWSPNEGWIGLSLATWLRTDMGAGLRGNTEEMNKLEGRWVQDALGPVYSKGLSIAGFSKPLKRETGQLYSGRHFSTAPTPVCKSTSFKCFLSFRWKGPPICPQEHFDFCIPGCTVWMDHQPKKQPGPLLGTT